MKTAKPPARKEKQPTISPTLAKPNFANSEIFLKIGCSSQTGDLKKLLILPLFLKSILTLLKTSVSLGWPCFDFHFFLKIRISNTKIILELKIDIRVQNYSLLQKSAWPIYIYG